MPTGAAPPRRRRSRPLLAAGIPIAAFVIGGVLWGWLQNAPPRPVVRYSMVFPEGEAMATAPGLRFALSPDGRRLVYRGGTRGRVIVRDRDRLHGIELPGTEGGRSPFFSPDGSRIGFFVFGSLRIATIDGDPVVTINGAFAGRLAARGHGDRNVRRRHLDPGDGRRRDVQADGRGERKRIPDLDPDGQSITYFSNAGGSSQLSYHSDIAGRGEVFVVPFPNAADARWSISPDGGKEPVWSHDGRELFYRDARGYMHAVEVRTTPTFSVGRNTVLFDARPFTFSGLHPMYSVSLDDRRFLMVRRGEPSPGSLIVVENWFEELTHPRRDR